MKLRSLITFSYSVLKTDGSWTENIENQTEAFTDNNLNNKKYTLLVGFNELVALFTFTNVSLTLSWQPFWGYKYTKIR